MRSGRRPSVVSTAAPISASGVAMRSIGRERSDSSPVSSKLPSWPASRPGSRRASVPALPQSIARAPEAAQAGTRTRGRRRRPPPPPRRAREPRRSSTRCPPSGRSPRSRVSPSATAPSSTRAVRDRLVARNRDAALHRRRRLDPHSARTGETDDAVALRLEQRRRALGLVLAGDEHRQDAAALGREVPELEVLDVDPLGAERLGDPGEDAGPVGHVRPSPAGARPGRRTPRRASGGGSRTPRRSSARASRRRRAASHSSSRSTRRRCSASASASSGPLSRKMSTQMRGFAPATRVMSRSEPPAAASGSCPSIFPAPAWLTSRLASACGRWLVSATRRSCAAGSIATGTAPSEATKPWTSR